MAEENTADSGGVQSQVAGGGGLTVSDEVKENFPNLIKMIEVSESMNLEEKQYWVDVLPVMTEEQIQNLKNILMNEKSQMEAANQSYEEGVKKDVSQFNLAFNEEKYKEKRAMWKRMEKEHESKEDEAEKALLAEIESMQI